MQRLFLLNKVKIMNKYRIASGIIDFCRESRHRIVFEFRRGKICLEHKIRMSGPLYSHRRKIAASGNQQLYGILSRREAASVAWQQTPSTGKGTWSGHRPDRLPGTPGRPSETLFPPGGLKFQMPAFPFIRPCAGGCPVSECRNSGWKKAQSATNPRFAGDPVR